MPTVEIETQAPPSITPQAEDTIRFLNTPPAKTGRSSKKRQDAIREMVRRMQFETRKAPDGTIEGPLRPCTLVNFNPLPLVIQGQIRLTVPKFGTTKHHQVVVDWNGRRMQGHYCVIASPVDIPTADKGPVPYTTVIGHEQDSVLPIDVPTCEARMFTPWSIGCEVIAQYNSPSTKLMGGVLLFDQDIHAIGHTRLERTGGKIYIPERTQLPDSVQYVYRLREASLEEELDRIFEAQHNYFDVKMQQAHANFVEGSEVARKMITDTDRDWARYGLEKGWLEVLPEWVSAKLALNESVSRLAVCRYCGEQQRRADVYFCKQNHPFDVLTALKAGLVVPQVYIEVLEDEQLEEALAILDERKKRMKGRGRKAAAEQAKAAEEPQE